MFSFLASPHSELVEKWALMEVSSILFKMSKTPGRIGPVPTQGQHTRILGYDRATLEELRLAKVIA
jgi:hypothetical protein